MEGRGGGGVVAAALVERRWRRRRRWWWWWGGGGGGGGGGSVAHLARVVRDDEGHLGELGDALVRDRLALDLVAVLADARLAEDGRAPGRG